MFYTPAALVIMKFGGVRATARAIGITPASVSRWQKPRKWKGSSGIIPLASQRKVLRAAKLYGIDLTLEDLNLGRVVSIRKHAQRR